MKEKQDSFNILENKLFRMKENVIYVIKKIYRNSCLNYVFPVFFNERNV